MSDREWITVNAQMQYATPVTPNFIAARFQDGIERWIAVEALTDEELRELAKRFGDKLIERAAKRRGQK